MNLDKSTLVNQSLGNVAIIGFATDVPFKNRVIALVIGTFLALRGYNVSAGNFVGTFSYAFWAANFFGGRTLAIVDDDKAKQPHFIDRTFLIPKVMKKHQQLALLSSGAIVIGGGDRSLHLVKEFIKLKKPVIAICNTHGIVDSEIQPLGVKIRGIFPALEYLVSKLSLLHKKPKK